MKTTVSFLKSKYSLEDTLKKIQLLDADYIHVDVMDGKFVENSNFGPEELVTILTGLKKPLDIHLMVVDPLPYIASVAPLKPKYITTHVELTEKKKYIDLIHNHGISAGLAINPETDIHELLPYLSDIQYVIVMSVHPGKGGQKLIPETIDKVKELQVLKKENNYEFDICVDGGVNLETRKLVSPSDVIVLGSALCMQDDYEDAFNKLR